ncbi:choice-of-anchor D domain-containing protein [Leptospira levettii]|uniref:choice-of-anchor D domain-containing protein n=1 Tax=Leptospira levettii TaxID=2023178 RepID=UPI00223CE55A|nr:choice-of-anchor D domain-containing protein [Leptospira levettii]MCW7509500.1 choice-of-anchor D domain-containing protein [Leptospira levettii]MCW7520676.1 choice-of-anchor D domain-containing protein [Leptospira levettii]
MQKKYILIPLFSIFTFISCPGAGGGGGGAAFALLGLGGGGTDVGAPKLEVTYSGVVRESGASIDLGTEPINTTNGKLATLTIQNKGTTSLTLPGSPIVTISGTDSSHFQLTQPNQTTLAPNASVTFSLRFKPTSTGLKTAVVKLSTSDPALSAFQLTFTGTGGATAARLALSQGATEIVSNGSYSMGSVEEQSSGTPIQFTISNTGSLSSTLGTPVVESSNAQFTVSAVSVANGSTLAQDGTFTFNVTFSPANTTPTSKSATITVNATPSNFIFTVNGTATVKPVPTIAISHNSSSYTSGGTLPTFGAIWPGNSASQKQVTITNNGTATLTGLAVNEFGTNTDQFTTSSVGSSTLTPGQSTTFTVNFAPTATGAKTAIARVTSTNGNNGSASSADINLEGTGKSGADVLIAWTAAKEKAPNDTDGGYKVCYSKTTGFDPASVNGSTIFCDNVPYTGGTTPTSKTVTVNSAGTWYFKVYAFGKYKTTGGAPSTQVSAVVP